VSDDLVKRLRNNCSCNFLSTPCGAEEQCRNAFEAADRIEKLETLVEQLRDDNSSLIDSFDKDFLRQEDRIVKLESALTKIAQHDLQAIAMDALRPGERVKETEGS
jgi:hypothetical protein